jgi:hypothetical protein
MEKAYPFSERTALYEEMSVCDLKRMLREAREKERRAIVMLAEGFTFDGRIGPCWRANDVTTIDTVIRRKMFGRGAMGGNMVTIDDGQPWQG